MSEPRSEDVPGAIALLKRIEQMDSHHQHCYGCPVCLAHEFLYGHFPKSARRCCWPRMAAQHSGRDRLPGGVDAP